MISYDPESGRVRLVIADMGPGDEGTYACTAENEWGDSTCSLQVTSNL